MATIQSRGSTSFSFLKDPFPHATLLLIIWYYCLSLSLSLRKRTLFFSLHDLFFLSTSEVYRKTWDQGGTNTFVFQTSTVPLDKHGSPSPSCLISFYFLDKKHDSLSLLFNLCLLSRQNTCFSLSFLISFYSLFLSFLLAKISLFSCSSKKAY